MHSNTIDTLRNLLTPEALGWLFGRVCLVAAVYFVFETGVAFDRLRRSEITQINIPSLEQNITSSLETSKDSYNVISNRNIFTRPESTATTPAAGQAQELKLRLVGTYVGLSDTSFAILENDRGEQQIVDLNQQIFERATLLEVAEESIRLNFNGREMTLALELGTSSGSASDGVAQSGDTFTVAEAELEDALNNLPRLLSQARAVPYFRNGQSIGMRLFAIRRESLYEKLGLQNGDIILDVNNNSVSDPSQALKIFEQLKSERSIRVKIERRGEERTLNYDIR